MRTISRSLFSAAFLRASHVPEMQNAVTDVGKSGHVATVTFCVSDLCIKSLWQIILMSLSNQSREMVSHACSPPDQKGTLLLQNKKEIGQKLELPSAKLITEGL